MECFLVQALDDAVVNTAHLVTLKMVPLPTYQEIRLLVDPGQLNITVGDNDGIINSH